MNFYNEMYDAQGGVRGHYKGYEDWLKATPPERIERKRAEAVSFPRFFVCQRMGFMLPVFPDAAL